MINPGPKRYTTTAPAEALLDPSTSHGLMVRMVGRGKRVLEFGCAAGYMSRFLSENGNHVTGIEIDPVGAEEARAFCDRVFVADLDVTPLDELLPDAVFDVLIFGDVLEHVRDPWKLLAASRALLAPDGYVVISIPNVAHGNVRLALLRGSFEYAELGLLDNTHLRFFTLRSLRELCLRAGFTIEDIERTKVPLFGDTDLVPRAEARDFDASIVDEIRRDPEHDTLQFVLRAVPIADGDRVRVALDALSESEMRAADAATRIERLERQLREYGDVSARFEELEVLLADQTGAAERAQAVADELRAHLATVEAERDALRADAEAFDEDRRLAMVEELASQRARTDETDAALASVRDELAAARAGLAEYADERLAMVEELATYRARSEEREAALAELRGESAMLRSQLTDAARTLGEAYALRSALERAEEALAKLHDSSRAALAERDADLSRLRGEAAAAHDKHGAVALALEELRRDYASLHAAHAAIAAERETLVARLTELEAQGAARDAASAATIADLRRSIVQKSAAVDVELEALRVEREALHAEHVRVPAGAGAVAPEAIQRLDAELQRVTAAHSAVVRAFTGHVDAELAMVRAEMAEIDGMIQRIQRSPAWLLKKAVGRLRRVAIPGGRARV